MVLDPKFLDQIKGFEGFYAKPYWDHKQWSVGYGSRAAGPNDAVDQAEADRRLNSELASAAAIVDRFAPNLDPGTRAALTSLTYNAGSKWTESGLGQAIKRGDMDAARASFLQYNKASGQTLPGLQKRRAGELAWFGQGGNSSRMSLGGPMDDPRNTTPSGGGYGVDPDGAAGVSGSIHTSQPRDAGVMLPQMMGSQPLTGSQQGQGIAPSAPVTPDFNQAGGMDVLAGLGGFLNAAVNNIPQPSAPRASVDLPSMAGPRVSLDSVMAVLQDRAKRGGYGRV